MAIGDFCSACGHNIGHIIGNADGVIPCPNCGAESMASDEKKLAYRSLQKFLARKDCCKDQANLSDRGDVVKCGVCGERNIRAADKEPFADTLAIG